MATYVGFSTLNADAVRTNQIATGVDGGAGSLNNPIRYGKKFRTIDEELVITDFINSLNISQGQKPGRPEYGTTLWSFVFEPNTLDVKIQLEAEIRRMINLDPRLLVNTVNAYQQENGILLEIEIAIAPFNNPVDLAIFFDQATNTASRL